MGGAAWLRVVWSTVHSAEVARLRPIRIRPLPRFEAGVGASVFGDDGRDAVLDELEHHRQEREVHMQVAEDQINLNNRRIQA